MHDLILKKIMNNHDINQNLKELYIEWLNKLQLQKNYSFHTIRAYSIDLLNFSSFMREYLDQVLTLQDFHNFKIKDFRAWLAKRRFTKVANISNARSLSVIRSFYLYLNNHYQINNYAITTIRMGKLKKSLPKAIEEEMAIRAINKITSIAQDEWIGWRDTAILTLLYGSGMKIGEVLKINLNQLISNDDCQTFHAIAIIGKGNKERIIPLLAISSLAIKKYISFCPYNMDQYLFLGLRGDRLNANVFRARVRKLKNAVGLPPHTSPHVFRHSFASHLLDKGVSLRVIQDLLGHKNLVATQNYLKISNNTIISEYHQYNNRKNIVTTQN